MPRFLQSARSTRSGISFLNGIMIFLPTKSSSVLILSSFIIAFITPSVSKFNIAKFNPWFRRFAATFEGDIVTLISPLATPARRTSGVFQMRSFTSCVLASSPCMLATAIITLGIAGAPHIVKFSFAKRLGAIVVAPSAAPSPKNPRLFITFSLY